MYVMNGAGTTEFVQTKPSSGRKGDRGSGGRSPRNFSLLQISPSEYRVKDYVLHLANFLLMSQPLTPSETPAGRRRFEAQKEVSSSAELDLRNFLKKVP